MNRVRGLSLIGLLITMACIVVLLSITLPAIRTVLARASRCSVMWSSRKDAASARPQRTPNSASSSL